jgi:hypothetical protein
LLILWPVVVIYLAKMLMLLLLVVLLLLLLLKMMTFWIARCGRVDARNVLGVWYLNLRKKLVKTLQTE